MKILQVVPVFSDPFGGPVAVVRSISKELAKKHEVVVYTTTALDLKHDFDPYEEEVNGYRVIYFRRTFKTLGYTGIFGQLNLSYDMMQAVKKNLRKFDVVHVHSWQQFPDIIVHFYAKKWGVPYVLQVHGSLPRIMGKKSLKLLYDALFGNSVLRDASKVIALTLREFEQYREMGVPGEKIVIVPNGIDLSEYSDLPTKGSFKKKHSIDAKERIILYLGRIHRIKGVDILVRAFASISDKLHNVRLVIVGPDDGYLADVKSLINALKISDKTLFVGGLYGKEKLEAYVDADLYVLPSRYETFPMSLLEAYACAKPVISSGVYPLTKSDTSKLVDLKTMANDVGRLAISILSLLENPDRAYKMGLNGRIFAENNFSIETVANHIENIYRSVSR